MFITQGFFQRGWGGVGICPPLTVACPPPLPLGRAEIFILYVNQLYKGFSHIINGIRCENSPRFHQIASNKRSKIKISPGEYAPGPP